MAIVNKFNVNKEQVTLDADIIENISANDVSYNSSLQYDENTVGDKFSELDGDIDDLIELSSYVLPLESEVPSDFDIADDRGNVIVRFSDGHISTLKFDSSRIASSENYNTKSYEDDGDSSLDVTDFSGNVIVRFKNGHIATQNFDSAVLGLEVSDINLSMANLRYKLAAIERGQNVQCVIGLLGDSWTQHNNDPNLDHHSNYCQPFAKYLRDTYGDAGGGFYSFSVSNGSSKMASVDYEDAYDARTGSFTERDSVSGVRWVDGADITFNAGAELTLNIKKAHDKLVLHFYGDSASGVFSYKLDDEDAVSVDASTYTGHSMIEISCSNTTHTLVITELSGSTMIYGVDLQKTGSGVRVHKLGNKGISAWQYATLVDVNEWKVNVASLGLDTMTILLGTNDGAGRSDIGTSINTIISRVKNINPFVDICVIQPSDNIYGYTPENGGGSNMDNQAKLQYSVAKTNGVGFINLRPLFGSPAQIYTKGTFFNDVHPTWDGGRMIAYYLIKKII